MRRGPRKPGKYFSTYIHEDRSKWEIRVGATRGGVGHVFFCRDEGVNIEADNPDKVVAELKVKLTEARSIEWKPVIAVEYDSWRSSRTFSMEISRAFMGTPPFDPYKSLDQRPIFRDWSYDDGTFDTNEDRTELGKPGKVANSVLDHPFPYDPEIWAMLRGVVRAGDALFDLTTGLTREGYEGLEDRVKAAFKRYSALPPDIRNHPEKSPFDFLKIVFQVERKKK